MRTKKFKRLLVMLLAIVSIVSCFAVTAFAATSTDKTECKATMTDNNTGKVIIGRSKVWGTTGTVNGTLVSVNSVARDNTCRVYAASATNSKAVTKIIATSQVVNNATGATLDTVTKTATNADEVLAGRWVYTTNNVKLTNFTATETRAANSYVEYITHVY